MRPCALILVVLLAGCVTRLGDAPFIGRDHELVGTKLLRPGATGRSCRTTIFGVKRGAGEGTLDEAVAQLLARDDEGNVVTDAAVEEERLTTGIFNRRCVVVRGDLGRTVSTVTVPMPAGHQHPHGAD